MRNCFGMHCKWFHINLCKETWGHSLSDDLYVSLSSNQRSLPFPPQDLNFEYGQIYCRLKGSTTCLFFFFTAQAFMSELMSSYDHRFRQRHVSHVFVESSVCFLFWVVKGWCPCFLFCIEMSFSQEVFLGWWIPWLICVCVFWRRKMNVHHFWQFWKKELPVKPALFYFL